MGSVCILAFRFAWDSLGFFCLAKWNRKACPFVILEISSRRKCTEARLAGVLTWPASSFPKLLSYIKTAAQCSWCLGILTFWKINITARTLILLTSPFSAFRYQEHRIWLYFCALPSLVCSYPRRFTSSFVFANFLKVFLSQFGFLKCEIYKTIYSYP